MKTFKLLCLGNSFSLDSTYYLYDILKSLGYEKIIIANLFIPGCDLKTHSYNLKNNIEAYEYIVNDSGQFDNQGLIRFSDAIKKTDWDFITIQQASYDSGIKETYKPYLDNIIAIIKQKKLLKTKIYFNQTWSYQKDSNHDGFKQYQNNQAIMDLKISSVLEELIIPNKNIDGIIMIGNQIKALRKTSFGDKVTIDGHHLNYLGKVAAGLKIYQTLTGNKYNSLKLKINDLKQEEVELILSI